MGFVICTNLILVSKHSLGCVIETSFKDEDTWTSGMVSITVEDIVIKVY